MSVKNRKTLNLGDCLFVGNVKNVLIKINFVTKTPLNI